MQAQGSTPQLEEDINRLEAEIERLTQEKLCYEAQILRVLIGTLMKTFDFLD